jgi:hypothetical protein
MRVSLLTFVLVIGVALAFIGGLSIVLCVLFIADFLSLLKSGYLYKFKIMHVYMSIEGLPSVSNFNQILSIENHKCYTR